jgi:putative membrane protein
MIRTPMLLAALALAAAPLSASAQASPPTDAQIAHIAYTAGELDVAAGKQALAKSKNKAVREFAETMVRDHAAVNTQALALVKKLGVTPQANPISASLSADAAAKLSQYAKLDGAAFDRAYVQNEIAYHRTVNGALEATLIPTAQNPELKGLLQTGLTLFRAHQQHAEHLAAAVK